MRKTKNDDDGKSLNSKLTLAHVALAIVCIVGIPVALDQAFFRGFYLNFVEPESTAGTTILARRVQEADYVVGMHNVLVIGDSRIGEGFSPKIANEVGRPHGYNFIRVNLAGTTPRVWYYFLRTIDPRRIRFHAVYLMTDTLRDEDTNEDLANRSLDTSYLAPLLDWEDILSYPESFSDPKEQARARNAVAFPAASYRRDIIGFLKTPLVRVRKSMQWRENYPSWLGAYPGRPERLPDAETPAKIDDAIASLEVPRKADILGYLTRMRSAPPQPNTATFAYRSRWYGGIAESYAKSAVSIGVFLVPRGPYHAVFGKASGADGALKSLERKGLIKLVEPATSIPFEKPEFFFDSLHLNAAGREAFSRRLAEAIVRQLN